MQGTMDDGYLSIYLSIFSFFSLFHLFIHLFILSILSPWVSFFFFLSLFPSPSFSFSFLFIFIPFFGLYQLLIRAFRRCRAGGGTLGISRAARRPARRKAGRRAWGCVLRCVVLRYVPATGLLARDKIGRAACLPWRRLLALEELACLLACPGLGPAEHCLPWRRVRGVAMHIRLACPGADCVAWLRIYSLLAREETVWRGHVYMACLPGSRLRGMVWHGVG